MSTETVAAAEAAPEAPSKAKLPLLIGLVAVGLALGGGTGAMVLGPMVAKKMGKELPAITASADSLGEDAGAGEHAAGDGKEGETSAAADIHLIDNLVLNPANSGGSRFLLLSVAIEVGSSGAGEKFKSRDAELRDIILTSLGTKTVEQLVDIAGREQFKTEIQSAVDARFGKHAVKRLYFPQFVVQ